MGPSPAPAPGRLKPYPHEKRIGQEARHSGQASGLPRLPLPRQGGEARLVRGQILQIKKNEYVLAARALGAKSGRIIRRHILPNCMSVIFISVALQIPNAIFTESFLSFVGLGVQAPMPSLGSLANMARGGLQSYPYKLVFPAMVICLIVLAFNLLGDGLRDAFDPRLRR